MKKLVFISLVLFSANCIAQNCKYSQNGVDKFTGKLTKVTKDFKFIETFASEGFLSIQKADTSLSLTLTYRTSFSSKIKVNDGAELSFLLEDGSIITIKKAGVGYVINSKQLKKLMTTRTKTLRYYYTDNGGIYKFDDIEIKKSNAEDLMERIPCVL